MSTKIRKTGQYQTKTAIKAAYQKGRQAARQCQLDWELEWDKDTKRQLKEIQRIADPEARAKEFQRRSEAEKLQNELIASITKSILDTVAKAGAKDNINQGAVH